MNRASGKRKITRQSAETAERAGPPPKITIRGNSLVLRWTKRQAVQAMDAAGMTLERVVAGHLIPSLDATKTIYSKRRGQITQQCRVPDLRARFRALKLMTELRFEMANRQSQIEASNEPTFKFIGNGTSDYLCEDAQESEPK